MSLDQAVSVVGDTGIEPVTSTVSMRMARFKGWSAVTSRAVRTWTTCQVVSAGGDGWQRSCCFAAAWRVRATAPGAIALPSEGEHFGVKWTRRLDQGRPISCCAR